MPDEIGVSRVDKIGEGLIDQLNKIGQKAEWGAEFELVKATSSDYHAAKVIIKGAKIKKNWVQCNGSTHGDLSYSSPKPWKLQARFSVSPGSPLWEKKPPYIYNRRPQKEWSLGGEDVWAVSYENLAEALSNKSEDDVIDELLEDLQVSWAYSNGQKPPIKNSSGAELSKERIDVTVSIDSAIWSEFREIVYSQYSSRRKNPKKPSYAKLMDDAIDIAIRQYIHDIHDRRDLQLNKRHG